MNHLTTREKEILDILKKDPMISQEELAGKLKISRSAAAVHISNLMRKGYIVGKGYIFDEHSGILVIGKTWLEIRAAVDNNNSGRIEFSYRGTGCLLALELIRYRAEPTLITYLGRDETGDQIYNHLLQKGVKLQNIIRSPHTPTGKRLIVSGKNDDPYQVEDTDFENVLNQDAIVAKEELIKTTKILLIDGSLPPNTLEYLASKVNSHDIMSSVVNCPLSVLKAHRLLSHPQFYLVCHARDITLYMGARMAEPEDLFPACKQIINEGCYALVVIVNDQGLIMTTSEETVYLPASPLQPPCSVLGVTAGIAEGLASGYRMRMAVRRAMGGRLPAVTAEDGS